MRNPIPVVRVMSLLDAISYLILLGIAMPLKYMWDMPMAVRIVGSLHGVFFSVLGLATLGSMIQTHWKIKEGAKVMIASIIPLAPFFLDRWIKAEAQRADDEQQG